MLLKNEQRCNKKLERLKRILNQKKAEKDPEIKEIKKDPKKIELMLSQDLKIVLSRGINLISSPFLFGRPNSVINPASSTTFWGPINRSN